MTGLATLAHTVPAPPPFNSTYYATAATVIPVLFLALAVQGRLYEDLLKASGSALHRFRQGYRDNKPASRTLAAYAAAVVTSSIAVLILIFGAVGEIQALIALNLQRPVDSPGFVLIAAVSLTIAAAGARPWPSQGSSAPPGRRTRARTERLRPKQAKRTLTKAGNTARRDGG